MAERSAALLLTALALGVSGCAGTGVPVLPPGSSATETASTANPSAPLGSGPEPVAKTVMAAGTPTEVYELVASGALGCWFGVGGPLKDTHVFRAEAKPPADGGAAEIVLYERDDTFSDRRGPRAFRVALTHAPGGAQVSIANIKMPAASAEAMFKDTETWATGGKGCDLRRLFPPPAVVQEKAKPKAKGKVQAKATKQP